MRIPFQIESRNKNILGLFHIAARQKNIPIVVVMCYGLNGNRVEQHRMSVKMGDLLQEKGINMVRFDYCNTGVSEGNFFDTTIVERRKNLIDICNYINGCFNRKIKIYLIGFSDGAKIAANTAHDIPECSGVIFWNPIIKIPSIDKDAQKKKYLSGKLKLHPIYKKPYKPLFGSCLSDKLMREIENDKSLSLLYKQSEKLFIFAECDNLTREIRKYLTREFASFSEVTFHVIEGSNHLFCHSEHEKSVCSTTINWILSRQDNEDISIV